MSTDPSKPEDRLEGLFAAEEARIGDNGFTDRVMERTKQAERRIGAREIVLFGSALAGAGFAVRGILEMAPHLNLPALWSEAASAVREAGASAGEGIVSPLVIAAAAVVAGVTFLLAAVAVQDR